MEQIENLLQVAETIRNHDSSEAAQWFLDGVNQYLTCREYISLDVIFGLNSTRGNPTPRTRFMKSLRNHYLKMAYKYIDDHKKPTPRCDELAKEIRDFEARTYLNWKHQGGPPQTCSELRKYLYLAKETGASLPTDWRAVYRLIFGY